MVEQKVNKVPQIRFKGFAEGWKQINLGEILIERNVLQKISETAPILAFAAGQGVIPRSERRSNNRDHLTLDQANKFYKLTEYDDIVYNPSNLKYGAIDRNKYGRGVISPIYVTFTTNEIPCFIEPIVKGEKFKLKALLYEEGTVVKRQSVKPENLLSLEVWITSNLQEQSLVGRFFQELDNLIGLHQRKHDKLVALKKAMLQKMFPQPGAATPEIRFNGFAGPWERKTFAEVVDVFDGTHQTPKYTTEGVMFLSVENILTLQSAKFISEDAFKNEFKTFPQKGDVLMTRIGDIGTANVVESEEPIAYYVSLALLKMKLVDSYFVKYCISSDSVIKELFHRTLHIAFPKKINKNEIEKIEVLIPQSKDEQQKIGTYFRTLDQVISKHATQLQKLQQIKSACLEKMFV